MTLRSPRGLLAALCIALAACESPSGGNPVQEPPIPRYTQVSASDYYTCATADNGWAYCWGRNESFKQGRNDTISSAVPRVSFASYQVASVSAGWSQTCFVTKAAQGYCTTTDGLSMLSLGSGMELTSVVAGYYHTIAGVGRDSRAYSFAFNGTFAALTAPENKPVRAVTRGGFYGQVEGNGTNGKDGPGSVAHMCLLTADGMVYCYGSDQVGERGDGPGANPAGTPVASGATRFESISGDGSESGHVCAVAVGGAAYCWGMSTQGEIGSPTTELCMLRASPVASTPCSTAPAPVTGGLLFRSLDTGTHFTCGVTTAGAAYCWGQNDQGQLGNGSTTSTIAPVAVSGGHTFASVSAGRTHACGLTTTAEVYCWGAGTSGELGNGARASSNVPVRVAIPAL